MIVAVVPPAPPVTTPVSEPTLALSVLLLLHVPPAGVEFNVAVLPAQIGVLVIVEGLGFTVKTNGATFTQPVGSA